MITRHSIELDWLHSLFQELQNEGVELPMGDYRTVYDIIETIRDEDDDQEWWVA